MDSFLRSEHGRKYASYFAGTRPGTSEFNSRYDALAARDGVALDRAQHEFLKATHYEPARTYAAKRGIDMANPVIQEVVWSLSTQHSPAGWRAVIDKAVATGAPSESIEALINALYEKREEYARRFAGPSATTNRYKRERDLALTYQRELEVKSDPDSAPVAPRLYAQTAESWKPAEPTEPVDPAKITELQKAFDQGASRAELIALAQRLNLEFKQDQELIAAIAYRDKGGKGAMIIGAGFNPRRRK